MFTQGQLIFAIFFFIAFLVLIVFSYRKDKGLHKKYYKGSFWVPIGFLVFVCFLLLIKHFLKD